MSIIGRKGTHDESAGRPDHRMRFQRPVLQIVGLWYIQHRPINVTIAQREQTLNRALRGETDTGQTLTQSFDPQRISVKISPAGTWLIQPSLVPSLVPLLLLN